jgi:hypothetical protein
MSLPAPRRPTPRKPWNQGIALMGACRTTFEVRRPSEQTRYPLPAEASHGFPAQKAARSIQQ